ncbi:MAG: branched-chain amino acid ABC transporter permease [Armatimonadota bacterium]
MRVGQFIFSPGMDGRWFVELYTSDQILQFIFSGITVGSIYAIIALGFSLIYSATNIINLAQGEFVMLGAMFAIFVLNSVGIPLAAAVLIAIVLVAAVGAFLGFAAVRRLQKASPISLIIVTVGASIFLKGCAMRFWGKDALPLPAFSPGDSVNIGGASLTPQSLWVFGITGLMLLAVFLLYEHTTFGKAMKAAAVNKNGARLVGISVNSMVIWAFTISAAIGAVGGTIIAPITLAQWDLGTMLGLKGFCAAILGGLGSGGGAIVGGLTLGILESLGAGLISSAYKDAIAFLILLLILFIKPTGFFGGGNGNGQ